MLKYLAHKDNISGREQSVFEHLSATSEMCGRFAGVFGAEVEGKSCGLMHDIGKYSEAFQKRINGGNNKADHSTAGAVEALRLLKNPTISMCIAGHHSGLLNIGSRLFSQYGDGTYFGRIKAKVGVDIEDYSKYKDEVAVNSVDIHELFREKRELFFYTHMLYSCLVDADYLDTEAFYNNTVTHENYLTIAELYDKLNEYIIPWQNPTTILNKKRCKILNSLIASAPSQRGLFTLSVPTGGGKTVSSMAFALRHALCNKLADGSAMRRIIYVIPYISIIEQTQEVFEKIFGSENVVAHYSDMDFCCNDDGTGNRKKLSAENWGAPIILTTAVQFFESIFSNRSSACRKLHNIAGSVLVFDEAQMMPSQYITPCLCAISQLVRNYYCSAVLCTATRPAFDRIFRELLPEYPLRELCPESEKMYNAFRRVTYIDDGFQTAEGVANMILSEKQVLCIVNTKKQAQKIYELIKDEGSYHLSTSMIPDDRRRTLEHIRQGLADGRPCRVVSTSLIEAGVDVDFPTVFREYAGLDSIIQAGGRCNREGKHKKEESIVRYFRTETAVPQYIRQNVSAAERTMRKHKDIASPSAIDDYFTFLLYTLRDKKALDAKEIMDYVDNHNDYQDAAAEFKLIEGSEYSVIITRGEGMALAEQLRRNNLDKTLLRKLGRFTVKVYENFFNALVSCGKAELITDGLAILTDNDMYSDETGLTLNISGNNELIF